jgi:hypothetical protein
MFYKEYIFQILKKHHPLTGYANRGAFLVPKNDRFNLLNFTTLRKVGADSQFDGEQKIITNML